MNTTERQQSPDPELLDEISRASALMLQADSPVLPTELVCDQQLSELHQTNVWLASELHQPIGAYKIRGAYNFVQSLSEKQKALGIVTASAGNHAQGIALAGRLTGVQNHIFMPSCTPVNKIERVVELGGQNTQITLTGSTFDECQKVAKEYAKQSSAVFASPFDDMQVVAGQGTWGAEIAELIEVDMVFVPVGGMGLLAGVSTAIKDKYPEAEVVGVEPAGAASLKLAMDSGQDKSLKNLDTFVDGAAVKQVGSLPYRLAAHLVKQVLEVSRREVAEATQDLWERPQAVRPELAGALSVAGLSKYCGDLKGKNVVCLLSGGNLSPHRYETEVRLEQSQQIAA